MAALDIVFLLVLAASVLLGVWRGLVYEVLSVAGWVAAFFLAQWYAGVAADWVPLTDTAEPIRYGVGFVLVFVAVVFAAGLLSWLIKQGIESVGLRPVDRALGAGFGLLRGVVLLLALALVVNMTPLKNNEAWRTAQGTVWLDAGLHALKGVMPEKLAQYFP
ncbi:MAG TPA: CvpA family protein [Macromonas sp.]|nr:CvpA family protein [Macromonas sp.]